VDGERKEDQDWDECEERDYERQGLDWRIKARGTGKWRLWTEEMMQEKSWERG